MEEKNENNKSILKTNINSRFCRNQDIEMKEMLMLMMI